jgi:hypothetical protein
MPKNAKELDALLASWRESVGPQMSTRNPVLLIALVMAPVVPGGGTAADAVPVQAL